MQIKLTATRIRVKLSGAARRPRTYEGRCNARIMLTATLVCQFFGSMNEAIAQKAKCISRLSGQELILGCTNYLQQSGLSRREQVHALLNRAAGYRDTKQFDLAVADAGVAIAMTPRDDFEFPIVIYSRAMIFDRMGKSRRAIEDYEWVLRLNPAFTGAKEALARLRQN